MFNYIHQHCVSILKGITFVVLSASLYSFAQSVEENGAAVTDKPLQDSAQVKSQDHTVFDSDARLEFFKIIEGNPELVTADEPTMQIQNPTRKPAGEDGEALYEFLVGKIETDPNKEITYYLEVRNHQRNSAVPIKVRDDFNATTVFRIKPGELIRMTEKVGEYLNLLRLESRNEGAWKNVQSRNKEKPRDLYFYYDWKQTYAINSHLQPIELALKIPAGKNTVTVFNKPGRWDWRDCKADENLCVGWPDQYAKIFLFDTALVDHKEHIPDQSEFALYYQIGFAYKTADGKFKYGMGWIPSSQAARAINYLPGKALQQNGLAGGAVGNIFMSDKQRRERFKKLFVFSTNATELDSYDTRWTRKIASTGESIFDVDIVWDFFVKTSYNKLSQTTLTEDLQQFGVTPGVGATAPIFVDLDISASASVTVPLSAQGQDQGQDLEPIYLMNLEQWLTYTSPFRIGKTPLRFSVGGYFLTMPSAPADYGFSSLIGFQGQVLLDNPTNYTYLKVGAVGADLNFKFRNRNLGLGFGYYLDAKNKYESWRIFGEVSDLEYSSPETSTKTGFDQFHIGVQKSF